ncbi:MAG: ribosome-associated translation inhibitor RaiA [Thermomicrobiales bacterium]|nr:ribosome-associated translation inhibitor RaiA [Thermomicrobiales bacterium]MCO5218459.1 ribosome-associated translation inhibitor RaiA [Thermomicrobiales bacterium]MCO5223733.1 ribosome-associated translation inhibitor RaiA [Thermomicrobiales bacterium]MCO5228565.1 ribosome-associated translation inhibitor RaiA [Thermomicrobiales bacterium]
MELNIRANGVKVTDGMREFIDKRMSKLDRLADHVVDAQLELKTETTRTGAETSTAQITLKTGRNVLRAEAEAPEIAKAVDMAIDKLVSQVRKVNDRKHKRGGKPINELVEPLPFDAAAEEEAAHAANDMIGKVARTKTFHMDPIGVETAIEQMELIGHDFYFFRNEEDETFTVLYRRKDGSYGLLSPD